MPRALPAVVVARLLGLPDDTAPLLKEVGYASVEQIGGFASEAQAAELRAAMSDLGPVGEAYGRARNGDGPGADTVIGALGIQAAEHREIVHGLPPTTYHRTGEVVCGSGSR